MRHGAAWPSTLASVSIRTSMPSAVSTPANACADGTSEIVISSCQADTTADLPLTYGLPATAPNYATRRECRARPSAARQHRGQQRREFGRHLLNVGGSAEIGQLCHCKSRVAAGVDTAERFQIHADVECQSVVAAAATDAQADAGELTA